MSATTKMSTVTTLTKFARKEEPEILPDGGTPLYISQWVVGKNKKKKCNVLENMEPKARAFTTRALTKDGEEKSGKETGEDKFPVQVKCMRHPKEKEGSDEDFVKEQIDNALSFDVWYKWLTGKKNILTKKKFNGNVILDYHGFSGVQMKLPLSWKINENDKEEVKKYKASLNKYCHDDYSYGEEGMTHTSPIHIYHFFLRPMFDLGYDIKQVIFLGCYSATIVKTFVDPTVDKENSPKLYFSMVTEMASVLKRFKRNGITVYGMSRVFLAQSRAGYLRLTNGGKHGKTSESDWANYNKVDIADKKYYFMTDDDREEILENLVSMTSDQGRDWILGAYPKSMGSKTITDEATINQLNLENSSVAFDQLKKIPKQVGNQCKRLLGKEYEEVEEQEQEQAGPVLFKSNEEYYYEIFPWEREGYVSEDDENDDEEEAEEYVGRYIDYQNIDWLDE